MNSLKNFRHSEEAAEEYPLYKEMVIVHLQLFSFINFLIQTSSGYHLAAPNSKLLLR